METEILKKLDRPVKNIKVLVHWEQKLVISTRAANTSVKYQDLIKLGYVQVGEYKPARDVMFWDDKYFNHDHKLLA